MNCLACGGSSRVLDTRRIENDKDCYIRRRRKCLSCRRKFTTYETYDKEDNIGELFELIEESFIRFNELVGHLRKHYFIERK